MTGGVELIDRALDPDPERGLDLGSLAGRQEPVKPLNACTWPRRVEAASPLAASDPITRSMSSAVASQAGQPSRASIRSSTPVSFSIVTGLNPRATHEAR